MYADYESVDTPIVERRKNNWFARQITRMGSVRSSSTAYSSGGGGAGLFGRARLNSVYASPEAGHPVFPAATNPVHQNQKMTLYERIVGRRSSRGQRQIGRQGTGKHNGAAGTQGAIRNRPRIPTPDVTKEMMVGGGSTVTVLPASAMTGDMPMVQVVLSPIQEADGGSHNNTLHAGQPGTKALAQAVLSPALTSAGLSPLPVIATPVTLTSLGLTSPPSTATLTELLEDPTAPPATPVASPGGTLDTPSRKTSVTSQTTAPAGSPKRGEVYV